MRSIRTGGQKDFMTDRKEYMRNYQRGWIRARREEFFSGKACVKCGSTQSLELDHIDRTKKIHHAVWSWTLTRRESELAKCQVLCKACHLEKTRGELKQISRPEKLTWQDVRAIRERVRSGQGLRAVGREFNITHSTVAKIRDNFLWKEK